MAASLNFYSSFKKNIGNGSVDLDTDLIRVALYKTVAGLSDATLSVKGSVTAAEVSGGGYTAGGKTLSGATFALSGSNAKFDAADTFFSANASTIGSVKGFLIYKSASGFLIGWGKITSSGSVDVTSTNRITLQWNASGIFTLS